MQFAVSALICFDQVCQGADTCIKPTLCQGNVKYKYWGQKYGVGMCWSFLVCVLLTSIGFSAVLLFSYGWEAEIAKVNARIVHENGWKDARGWIFTDVWPGDHVGKTMDYIAAHPELELDPIRNPAGRRYNYDS